MSKPANFQQDLVTIQAEMQHVGRIIEATRNKPAAKVVDRVDRGDSPPALPLPASSARTRLTRGAPLGSTSTARSAAGRENVTTRLLVETNELLTEAALKQKLKRARPDTRQDIIEAALSEWLKRHGYDRKKHPVGATEQEPTHPQQRDRQPESEAQFPLETHSNSNADKD